MIKSQISPSHSLVHPVLYISYVRHDKENKSRMTDSVLMIRQVAGGITNHI